MVRKRKAMVRNKYRRWGDDWLIMMKPDRVGIWKGMEGKQ
jgi:hypothetical protein